MKPVSTWVGRADEEGAGTTVPTYGLRGKIPSRERITEPHDIDVAVKFAWEEGLLELGRPTSMISRRLGVTEDLIDIVDLDQAKPFLVLRILREG